MKKLLSLAALLLTFGGLSWAYDFSAVAPNGQILYYKISNGNAVVTYPGELEQYSLWAGFAKPTGELIIPDIVVHENQSYYVTEIDGSAFSNCTGITSVTISNSVTKIDNNAFSSCTALASVTISNSVTEIDNWAFQGCSNLTAVILGKSVAVLGNCVFQNCPNLRSITSLNPNPPKLWDDAFNRTDKSIPVHVPAGSADAYRAADYWKLFTNIIDDAVGIAAAFRPEYAVRTASGSIAIEGTANQEVRLYDIRGRLLQTLRATDHCTLCLPSPGIYLLQVGNRKAEKIVATR